MLWFLVFFEGVSMANIAVFRVSRKQNNKWLLKASILIIVILLAAISLITFWLSNKLYVNSIKKTIRVESSSIVQSTNSIVFKRLIADNIPAANLQYGNAKEKLTGGIIGETLKELLVGGLLKSKSILDTQYPIIQIYYSKYPDISKQDSVNSSNTVVNKDAKQSKQRTGEDENEIASTDKQGTTDRIYSPSTVIKSGGITVTNHTSVNINIEKIKSEPLKLGKLDKKKTSVLILHTHTSEAYLSGGERSSADRYRTENPKYSVVRVGKELETQLSKLSIKSYHDTKVHDYPMYIGSYGRSLETAKKDVQCYPNMRLIFDIHRDAAGTNENMRTAAKIGGTETAKIMLVVGTNGMGLEHSNWRENLKLAIKLQQKSNELFPGLCKGIDLRKERFNQQVLPGALIVEVGATGDTLQEATASMKCFARVIKEVVK
jgi:stage II sporulation protein P